IAILLAAAASAAVAAPEDDRAEFIAHYQEKFPGIALDNYVDGALMLSRDAKSQFDSIMEFPPFQSDLDKGRTLWETPFANGRTYAGCFANGGRNVAGDYPRFDGTSGKVVTFEMALNDCRRRNGEKEFAYGDRATMGVLTAHARALSDGMRLNVKVEGAAALAKYEQGKRFYFTRIGQFNFACSSCHYAYAGQILRTEIISPTVGQATHWPVFRAGDNLNTLHMRIRRCMEQVRAAPFPAGSEELNNLEYFLAYLSNGLPLRASVYRK
ncbi:MAG TPA: sulfur oxidation c-type cytochrome SoxA, partial [Burkholderiales bacterium]